MSREFFLVFPACESCAVSHFPGGNSSLSLPTLLSPRRLRARCSAGMNPPEPPGTLKSGRETGQAISRPSLRRDSTLSSSPVAFFPPFLFFSLFLAIPAG